MEVPPPLDVGQIERAVAAAVGGSDDTTHPVGRPPESNRHRFGARRTGNRVLRDPGLDRRLLRDGFIKCRLIQPDVASALRSANERLRTEPGEGFEVDFWNTDTSYRAAAAQLLSDAVDPAIRDLFDGGEPFLHNFLVKWPERHHDPAFPQFPHRDWMFTDERAGDRSWVVWVALDDIDHDNGQFRVARSSHDVDDMLRGSDLEAGWLYHERVWNDRLVSIPLRRGEAVVFDSALVHCSYPNHSPIARFAAGIVVRRLGAQLVHFRRRDGFMARRHEIDPEVFLARRIDTLGDDTLDGTGAFVPIGGVEMSARRLAWHLDRRPLVLADRARSWWGRTRRRHRVGAGGDGR